MKPLALIYQKPKVNRLLKQYFPSCQEAKTAYAIAHAECKGKQTCNNRGLNRDGSIDFVYMQVNSIHHNKGGVNRSL